MDKKTKIVLTLGIAMMAVLMVLGIKAQGADTELVVQRTKMRDITVSFNSVDGLSAICEVYQRIMFWQDYEYAMSFNIDSGSSFNINMDVLSPIYRDMKFVCTSGDRTVSVNTVFAMGALIINQVSQNCPETTTTVPDITTTTICPTTTTTIPPACDSCCPTCHTFNQHCESNSDCCGGLYCQTWSSHKCKNLW